MLFAPGNHCPAGSCHCCVLEYWVDSASGDQAETGSGTELDPWINLNTPFNGVAGQGNQIYTDTVTNCCHVTIWVKGTIDYETAGNGVRNYLKRLYLRPWNIETVISTLASPSTNVSNFKNCNGCNWFNFDAVVTDATSYAQGWNVCHSGEFNTCTFLGTSTYVTSGPYGFTGCHTSTFNTCSNSINSTASCRGFDACHTSIFNSCEADSTCSVLSGGGTGFNGCSSSTFNSCIGAGTGATGYGFNVCSSSVFDECTGTGSGNSWAAGFKANTSSTFDTCEGYGYKVGAYSSYVACGFLGNTSSSFVDCSTSDKDCAPQALCDAYTCDV